MSSVRQVVAEHAAEAPSGGRPRTGARAGGQLRAEAGQLGPRRRARGSAADARTVQQRHREPNGSAGFGGVKYHHILAIIIGSLALQLGVMLRAAGQHHTVRPSGVHQHRKPESSSSFFANIEDLTDSTIRTRPRHDAPAQPAPSSQLVASSSSASASSASSSTVPATAHLHPAVHQAAHVQQQTVQSPQTVHSQPQTHPPPQHQQQQQHPQQQQQPQTSPSRPPPAHDRSTPIVNYPLAYNASEPMEFERLMERLLARARSRQETLDEESEGGAGSLGLAVASNRGQSAADRPTSMRFFRNNKTFASIVYANQPAQRRLINCHLVDLERHSSDVALFEAKYDIRTVDVDFRDFMRLIDCCTEIARLKPAARLPRPRPGGSGPAGQAPLSGATLLASSLPAKAAHLSGQQQHQQQHQTTLAMQTQTSSPAQEQTQLASPPIAKHQQAASRLHEPTVVSAEMAETKHAARKISPGPQFRALISEAVEREIRRRQLKTSIEREREHHEEHFLRLHKRLLGPGAPIPPVPPKPVGSSLSTPSISLVQHEQTLIGLQTQAQLASKRLVLGEVTPPPSAVDGHKGGVREAIQEVTSYDASDLMAIWRGILPGTNWCGMGDRATSYNDLGFEADIDICCRAHDFCPIRLSAFSYGYGLMNWSFYTRSHCLCDQNFLNCLQRAESPLSEVVTKLYFNIMKSTCLHDNETLANGAEPVPFGRKATLISLDEEPGSGMRQMQARDHSARHRPPSFSELANQRRTPEDSQMAQWQQQFDDRVRNNLQIPALQQSRLLHAGMERDHQM